MNGMFNLKPESESDFFLNNGPNSQQNLWKDLLHSIMRTIKQLLCNVLH